MNQKYTFFHLIYWATASVVFVYILLRTLWVPPAMDEVTTFFFYIQPGSFQPYYAFPDANNHLLNSLLAHLCYLIGGEGLWVIRIPSLLSFAVFAWYGYRFFKNLKNPYAQFMLLVLLFCTEYIIEFFGVSRGYGMSFAFLLGLMYHIQQLYQNYSPRHFYWGIFLNVLMLFSNLSLITWSPFFFILQVGILFIREKRTKKWIGFIATGLIYLFIYGYLISFALYLKKAGALYLWGGNTFYDVIFIGLSRELGLMNLTNGLLLTIPLLIIVPLVFVLNIKKMRWPEWIAMMLLIGFNLLFIAAHLIMHINYPPFRTGIQIYFVLIISYVLVLNKNQLVFLNYLSILPGIYILVFFLISLNFTHVAHWKRESLPISFVKAVIPLNQKEPVPLSVSTHTHELNTWNYYSYLYNNQINQADEQNYPNFEADLVVLSHRFDGTVPAYFDTIANQKSTQHVLIKNNRKKYSYEQIKIPDLTCKDEFFDLYKIHLDSLHVQNIKIGISFEIEKRGSLQQTYIAVRTDYSFSSDRFNLQHLRPVNGLIKLSLNLQLKPQDRVINIFIWNHWHNTVILKNITLFIEKTN